MARRLKAVGVVRVSKVGKRRNDSETGERFRSPEEQTSVMEELAERLGFELVKVFEDLNLSGGLMDRPGLNEAVRMIQAGPKVASVLLVAWLDRYSRDVRGGLETLDIIEAAGGSLYAADFTLDTREPDGRMMLQFYLGISERERRVKGRRMAGAAAAANLEGIAIAPLPPGLTKGEGRRIVLEPERARLIEPLFERAAAGDTWSSMRDWWSAETGDVLKHTSLQRMIGNRLYAGELVFDGVVSPVRHEALVGEELWQNAQRVRTQRPPRKRPPALLAGVLRCSGCGHPMTPSVAKRDFRVYKCQSRQNVSWTCPAPVSVSLELADAWVESELLRWAGDEEAVTTGDYSGAFEEADGLVAERLEALKRARRILLRGNQDEDEAAAELAELQAELEEAEAARASLELEQKAAGIRFQVRQEWPRLSLEQKARYIRAALESVTVHRAPLTEAGGRARAPMAVRIPAAEFVWTR